MRLKPHGKQFHRYLFPDRVKGVAVAINCDTLLYVKNA